MSDLPGDLVEEILCRVPATSINRLRYTCKGWNSLFNKKRFIRKHKDKAAKKCLVLMSKQGRVCLMSVNFCGIPSIEVKAEYSLVDPQASLDAFEIYDVSHCDSLLLCNNVDYNRIVVLNPCTGQTKWIRIQPRKIGYYFLGSYQDNKYGDKSYKILCYCASGNKDFEIYEINSNLWRTLDVTLDCELEYGHLAVSLKGKTYWFARDEEEQQLGMLLVSFDYTTERFERMLLPCHCPDHRISSLSVVREEKLSVLLRHVGTTKTEIWVTKNMSHETKVLSWNKVLTVDLKPELLIYVDVSFLVDEEKKFLLCCPTEIEGQHPMKQVYIVGEEENIAKQVRSEYAISLPLMFNYVPSLIRIQ